MMRADGALRYVHNRGDGCNTCKVLVITLISDHSVGETINDMSETISVEIRSQGRSIPTQEDEG